MGSSKDLSKHIKVVVSSCPSSSQSFVYTQSLLLSLSVSLCLWLSVSFIVSLSLPPVWRDRYNIKGSGLEAAVSGLPQHPQVILLLWKLLLIIPFTMSTANTPLYFYCNFVLTFVYFFQSVSLLVFRLVFLRSTAWEASSDPFNQCIDMWNIVESKDAVLLIANLVRFLKNRMLGLCRVVPKLGSGMWVHAKYLYLQKWGPAEKVWNQRPTFQLNIFHVLSGLFRE